MEKALTFLVIGVMIMLIWFLAWLLISTPLPRQYSDRPSIQAPYVESFEADV